MRKLIATGKSLIDWAGTAFTVVGWLGWAPAIIGIFVAVGGAVWAVVIGVPMPIAIMAGYCTIAGAAVLTVVLTLSPLAYRAFSRMAAAPVPHDAAAPQKPNAAVWQHLPKFTLAQAACLLADVVPSGGIPDGDAYAWFAILSAEIQANQIDYIPTGSEYVSAPGGNIQPVEGTEISREELQRFAERHGIRSRFLFHD